MTSYTGCSRRYGIPHVARTPPNLSRTTSSENSKPTSVRSPAANDASRRQNSISSECIPKRRRSRRGRIRECCAKTIAAFSTVYPKIFSGNGGVCPLARAKPGSPADQAELLQELPALISTFSKADCEVPVLLSASPNDYYDSPPSPQPEVPTWNSTVAAGCACQSPGFDPETAQGSPDECGVVESLLDSSNGLPDGEGGLHGVLGSTGDSNSAPGDPPWPPGVSGEYVNRERLAGEGAYYSAFRALRRSQWETDCCRGDDVASAHVAPWCMRLADKIKAEKWMNAMSFCSSDWSERDGQHGLSLNLNYQEIVDAWSDRGSVYVGEQCPQTVPGDDEDDDVDSPTASVDIGLVAGFSFWRVEDENGIQCNHTAEEDGMKSGIREARVLRYKEKRQARLFCKKIRYQVRKINAERRPRMKGRFVKRLADL